MPTEHFKELMEFFSEKMEVHLHGVDIVRNEEDGKYYLFDCNYMSSYNDSFAGVDLSKKIVKHINKLMD